MTFLLTTAGAPPSGRSRRAAVAAEAPAAAAAAAKIEKKGLYVRTSGRAPPSKYAELAPGGPSLEKNQVFYVLGIFKISGFFEGFLDVFPRRTA